MNNPILIEHKSDTHHSFVDEDGRRQGEYKSWYDNGNLWVHSSYVNDKRHGEYKRWHSNGNLREHSFYVNDKKHGEYKLWHQNGNLRIHCFYVNGEETDIPIPTTDEERFLVCLEHGQMEFIRNNS